MSFPSDIGVGDKTSCFMKYLSLSWMIEMGGGLFFLLLPFLGHVAFPSPWLISMTLIDPIVTNPPRPPFETARRRVASFLVTKRDAMAKLKSDRA